MGRQRLFLAVCIENLIQFECLTESLNVSDLSNQSADLPGKRLELLREVVPRLRRLAIMANFGSPIRVLANRPYTPSLAACALVDFAHAVGIAGEAHFFAGQFGHAGEALAGLCEQVFHCHRLKMGVPDAGGDAPLPLDVRAAV
jgi:hypothetical protein